MACLGIRSDTPVQRNSQKTILQNLMSNLFCRLVSSEPNQQWQRQRRPWCPHVFAHRTKWSLVLATGLPHIFCTRGCSSTYTNRSARVSLSPTLMVPSITDMRIDIEYLSKIGKIMNLQWRPKSSQVCFVRQVRVHRVEDGVDFVLRDIQS